MIEMNISGRDILRLAVVTFGSVLLMGFVGIDSADAQCKQRNSGERQHQKHEQRHSERHEKRHAEQQSRMRGEQSSGMMRGEMHQNMTEGRSIEASGRVVKESVSKGEDFDKIVVSGDIEVIYTPSKAPKVTLESSDNIFNHIDISVEDGTLTIAPRGNVHFSGEHKAVVTASSRDMRSIESYDSSSVYVYKTLNTDRVSIVTHDASEFGAKKIKSNTFDYRSSSSARSEVGKLKSSVANINVEGAGEFMHNGVVTE